jgi:hypothetical protein
MQNSDLQQKRIVAAAIDIGIALALAMALALVFVVVRAGVGFSDSAVARYVPNLVSFGMSVVLVAYVLGRDVLAGGRSIGKKLQGLRVVTGSGPITLMESAKRNAIFAIGGLLGLASATLQLIPFVGGFLACLFVPVVIVGILATVAAAVIEFIKITQDPAGIRLGDQFAQTHVTEE